MSTWLVVTAPRERTDELRRCLTSLEHPPKRVVVVTSRVTEPVDLAHVSDLTGAVIEDPGCDVNIARWWNRGLRYATDNGATEIGVFSSDVTGRPGDVDRLAQLMRATPGCVMAGPALGEEGVWDLSDVRTATRRVPGGCFMLAAEHRLRLDERFQWWYSDDDLEMLARSKGCVATFSGLSLRMAPDTPLTPDKARMAELGRDLFVSKWGVEPW